jgi:hypothetical protein
MRGARGIAIVGEEVFIANYSQVYQFDSAWRVIRTINHPSCANIHDILFRNGRLWVSSTCNDLLFEFDLDGNFYQYFNFRSYDELKRRLGWNKPCRLTHDAILSGAIDFRDPRSADYDMYDSLHVNGVCFLLDGDMLVLLGMLPSFTTRLLGTLRERLMECGWWDPLVTVNQFISELFHLKPAPHTKMVANFSTGKAAIVRIHRDGQLSIPVILQKTAIPIHSLLAEQDGTVLFNDTNAYEIVHFDPNPYTELSRTKVPVGFLRGIVRLPNGLTAVGNQHYVQVVDLKTQTVVDSIKLSMNPNEAVYDLKILPSSFQALPSRLTL